ncbi:serine/threonine protein kinase [Pseudomonas fulva]|uniref:serine/threonine-protein kinase n=1 Tax=Pseudomonas fulva TaxID=47880 RepID=UPI00142895AB|nr:serine/threonine-protein kinase [Pseudomonas fulva]NIX93464.1 serine/threonine protein kinase [Pseudomonas fulva]
MNAVELLGGAGGHRCYFATVATPLPGVLPPLLNRRYKLEGLLGAGGVGMVYRARDLLAEQCGEPQPLVAIKLLRDDVAGCPDSAALLYSEYALTRHLLHQGVVRVHSFEVDAASQRAFFSMQLLSGMPLDRLLCEQPLGLAWGELSSIALGLLDVLAFAHGHGVLHGDIKPSNLILGEQGVQLFDFGLGQAMDGVLDGLARLSRNRISAWTPAYAAPELLDGAPLSTASDLFAAACVIYELAGGKQPFGRLGARSMGEQHPGQSLDRPANLPAKVWPALRQALSLDPAARQSGVRVLQQALAAPHLSLLRRWFGQPQGYLADTESPHVHP